MAFIFQSSQICLLINNWCWFKLFIRYTPSTASMRVYFSLEMMISSHIDYSSILLNSYSSINTAVFCWQLHLCMMYIMKAFTCFAGATLKHFCALYNPPRHHMTLLTNACASGRVNAMRQTDITHESVRSRRCGVCRWHTYTC